MGELEELWKRHKGHKRVLFVKESSLGINNEITTDRTILKTLPNLPDDDEDATQRELDELENQQSGWNTKDYGMEFSHTPSMSKSAH